MITAQQFKACFGDGAADEWVGLINEVCPAWGINSPLRLAHFLAQTGHESMGYTVLKENLNYSAQALRSTWPRRFPGGVADQYARQPEKIANRAYADRMGNGPEESGDGWRFRGKGLIQLTGKDNVSEFAKAVGKTLDEAAEYLLTKRGALESACWFWRTRGLNALADADNLLGITRRINGGVNGLDDRTARLKRIKGVLGA